MTYMQRVVLAGLLFMPGMSLLAQSSASAQPTGQDQDKGFSSYVEFQGSSNSLGQVMSLDSSVGYNFNQHFGADLGLPFYFVHSSASTTSGGITSNTGLGNLHLDLHLKFKNPIVNYTSVLTGYAPTGDASKGFSTGRATFDWNNHLDHTFGQVTPFVEAGVANTVADTLLFSRPFTTLGFLTHYQAGASMDFLELFSVGASAYDILPSGQQTVFSKLVQGSAGSNPSGHGPVFVNNHETTGSSDIARDNGFSGWVGASPSKYMDLQLGYTHSVHYALNTVSFGVGFNLGALARKASRQ